jgi:LCCL domain
MRFPHAIIRVLSALLVIGAAAAVVRGQAPASSSPTGEIVVRYIDGSVVKLTLLDDRVEIATPDGKRSIPVSDIRKVDLGLRISDELSKQIDAAIADLGSAQTKKREEASNRLLGFRELAYPALKRATQAAEEPVAKRAEALIEKLKDTLPEGRLDVPDIDVIHLDKSKVSGRIATPILKAKSFAFGEVPLKLADARGFAARVPESELAKAALPDPGNLSGYRQPANFGKEYTFRVTGAARGSVWGTEVYTADSTLAAAAVHMGVLKVGETGLVTVTIMGPQQKYVGSSRNGVTTADFDRYPASYRIHARAE